MRHSLFALVYFFALLPATFASERIVSTEGDSYKAVGYSENPSERLAKDEACNAARRELISYVFGAAYQVNQNMVRSLGVLDYSQDVSMSTGQILIRGALTETSKSGRHIKCVISYPVEEAKIEKDRLKSAQNLKADRFTEIGDATDLTGGVLEIATIPENVDVFVDNIRWGTSPLRLNSKLSPGRHIVRLEHEHYQPIEETVDIGGSAKVRLERIMRRATGRLIVNSAPLDGARVFINEEEVATTPTNPLDLLAGQRLLVRIEHPETETYTQTLKLTRGENRVLNVDLPLRPSWISLNVKPSDGVSAVMDKMTDVPLNKFIQIKPGEHVILIQKDGYDDATVRFKVRGGERKALETVELKSIAAEVQRHKRNGPACAFGLHIGAAQPTIAGVDVGAVSLGLRGRYQLSRSLSFELVGAYDMRSVNYSDAKLDLSGFQIRVGLPLRIRQSAAKASWLHRWSIAPEAIYTSHAYAVNYKTNGSAANTQHSQTGYGGSLIYTIFTNTTYGDQGFFLDGRIGAHAFQDADGLKGATPLSIAIGGGVTW